MNDATHEDKLKQAFQERAVKNNVSLEHVEDYEQWFVCFAEGATFGALQANEETKTIFNEIMERLG